MPNGKLGDHPLTDMLVHGLHPFPADIEALLREILRLQPQFPDGRRPYLEQLEWEKRFWAWARGDRLDEDHAELARELKVLHSETPGGA